MATISKKSDIITTTTPFRGMLFMLAGFGGGFGHGAIITASCKLPPSQGQAEARNVQRAESIVTPKNLAEILENLQLSKKNLYQTLRLYNTPGGLGKYPTLTNIPIAYIEGRHRIEALRSSATKFIGVVLLSVRGEWIEFPTKLGLPEPDQAQIQSRLTQYSHESRYSDGDVYRMIRQCEVEHNRDKWLSPKSLRGTTLFRCLTQKDCWKAPKRSYMEIGKGNFVVLSSPIIEESYLHYKQLFLAALRHFTELSTENALQDIREEKIPARELEETKTYLNKLALCFGFDNPKIRKIRDNPSGEKRGAEFNLRKATSVEWRSGIPFTRTYLELESTGFLHRIKDWPQGMAATPLLVFSDIINGFFRTTPFERDLSLPGMAFEGPTGGAIRDHIYFNRQSGTRRVAPNRLPISVILPGQPFVRNSQVAENTADRQIIQRQGSQAITQNAAALEPIASPAPSLASVSDGEAGIKINTLTLPGPAGLIMAGTESYGAADPCTELFQAGNLPPARISLDPNLNASPAPSLASVSDGEAGIKINTLTLPGPAGLIMAGTESYGAADPCTELVQAGNLPPAQVSSDPKPAESPFSINRITFNALPRGPPLSATSVVIAKPAQANSVTLGPTTAYFKPLENPGSSLTPPSDRTTIA
ncbi:hypothetical protein OOU_Y34scaffold00964g5, partial [Pyricularia oryzae Y34]